MSMAITIIPTMGKLVVIRSIMVIITMVDINNGANNTYVESNEVDNRKDVVTTKEHPNVGDNNILGTANKGRGEGTVVVSAEDKGEHHDESKDTAEKKLETEPRI